MADTTEKRMFTMHPQLLFDVIRRQAGTLTKALCEGIMNSVDAEADSIEVTLSETEATIFDNGKGFRSRQEITDYFETFGMPHKEGDAVYGTFRMGRGQLFAFGRNTWRSGNFRMDVDIKNRGLDYELTESPRRLLGCQVKIELYQPLNLLSQREIADELRRAVRYVNNIPVTLNGEPLNCDAASEKWDHVDDDAYYSFGSGRLLIYNLGIFVNDHRAYSLGIGGTVVARKQLRLNFARNDVLNDCPVWQRISKVLRNQADTNIAKKKTALTADERALMARRLRSGDLEKDTATAAPVFQDATGRWLSIDQLLRMAWKHHNRLSCGLRGPRAERAQRAKLAVVLNQEHFEESFRVDDLSALVEKVIKPNLSYNNWPYKIADLDTLSPDDERYEIVPPDKLTASEKVVLRVCTVLAAPDFANRRQIVIGQSEYAEGWTDGESMIAINRRFLHGRDLASANTWTAIALLLCHEYCHETASTSDTHVHSPEFHEQYHDGSITIVPTWVGQAMWSMPTALANEHKRLKKSTLRELDRFVEAVRQGERFGKLSDAAQEAAEILAEELKK